MLVVFSCDLFTFMQLSLHDCIATFSSVFALSDEAEAETSIVAISSDPSVVIHLLRKLQASESDLKEQVSLQGCQIPLSIPEFV